MPPLTLETLMELLADLKKSYELTESYCRPSLLLKPSPSSYRLMVWNGALNEEEGWRLIDNQAAIVKTLVDEIRNTFDRTLYTPATLEHLKTKYAVQSKFENFI